MSKQSSLVKFQGKMDGVSFYRKKGGHFARMANGPSKQRILTHPKMARTRENISEFGGLAVMTKSFHDTLSKVSNLTDTNLRNRMAKVFRVITKRSTGIRGKRPLQVSQHHELLKNLEINSTAALAEVLAARYTTTHTPERTSATVSLQESSTREMVTSPLAATHFRLVHFLGALADTVFDETLSKYTPADVFFNTLSAVDFSDYLPTGANQELSVNIVTTLSNIQAPGDQVSMLQGLGIIFYEQIGDVYYPLAENSAMKIVDVF